VHTLYELMLVMFQLTSEEAMSNGRGGRRTRPYAFTEHGVAMLSAVLHSQRAVQMSIVIISCVCETSADCCQSHRTCAPDREGGIYAERSRGGPVGCRQL